MTAFPDFNYARTIIFLPSDGPLLRFDRDGQNVVV